MSRAEENLIKNLVRVTLRCNAYCSFCNIPPESEPDFVEPDEQTLLAQVRQAVTASKGHGIVISGGEPTLRRMFLKAAETARAEGAPWVEIQTNGLLVTRELASEMRAAGISKALVALLSPHSTVHDALTGVKGSWKKTVEAIRHLHRAGIDVIGNLLMTGPTTAVYPDLIRFFLEEFPFVKEVNFSAVSPTGRCANRPHLWPDFDVARKAVKAALSFASSRGVRCLNPFCGLPVCVGWEENLQFCVEAEEMKAARLKGRQLADITGLRNEGEKVHPDACCGCAYNTVCGGIWRNMARVRGDVGLRPPIKVLRYHPDLISSQFSRIAPPGGKKALIVKLSKGAKNDNLGRLLATAFRTKGLGRLMVSFTAAPQEAGLLPVAVEAAVAEGFQVIQVVVDAAVLADTSLSKALISSGTTECVITLPTSVATDRDSTKRALRGMANLARLCVYGAARMNVVPIALLTHAFLPVLEDWITVCERLEFRELLLFPNRQLVESSLLAKALAIKMERLRPRLQAGKIRIRAVGFPTSFPVLPYEDAPMPTPIIRKIEEIG